MTDSPAQRYRAARREQLARRTALLRDTAAEVLELLRLARTRIVATLAEQPSDYQRWRLPQVLAEIDLHLQAFGRDAGAAAAVGVTAAWQAGTDLVLRPLAAGGLAVGGVEPLLDLRQLLAIRDFTVDRIQDVGVEAGRRIRSNLGLVVTGAQPVSDAVAAIEAQLDSGGRARALTIVRTELGQAYSAASRATLAEAAHHVRGLRKQWRRSGKVHSREAHDRADGQVQPVDQPFVIGEVRMMSPHDPAAPASEVINCGCVMLPWVEGWDVRQRGARPFSAAELQRSGTKRKLQAERAARKSP